MANQSRESDITYRDDILLWDGCDLEDLARKHGTPLYVISERRLRQAVHDVREAFTANGIDAQLFFSVKTNPLPRILSILADEGVGAEVITAFELWLAQRAGIDGEKIVVNGTVMTGDLIDTAINHGAAIINIQSSSQLSALRNSVRRLGRRANVGLRVNPQIRSGFVDFTLSTGSPASPIGFVAGSKEWDDVLSIIRAEPLLHLRGLQFHLGSGIRRARPYRAALKAIAGVWIDIKKRGLGPEILDIGGGFSTSTLKELNLWEAIRFFALNLPQKPPASADKLVDDIARECADAFSMLAGNEEGRSPTLYLEPGRALSGPAQVLLLQVKDIVDRKRSRLTAVCDGGAMNLSLMLLTEYHEILPVHRDAGAKKRRYDLVGALPTPMDVVCRGKRLPDLHIGNFLAVMNTGAYFTSLGNTFGGQRPAIVIIDEAAARVTRRRETFADLVARDDID